MLSYTTLAYVKLFKQFKKHGLVSKHVMYLSKVTDACVITISLLH